MIKGFKEFVFRGNVIDLAVAVAVGTALAALVAAVTQALILSLLGGSDGIGGTITLSQGYELNFALLIGAVITFFVTLAALYLFFVAPMNRYRTMTGQGGVDTRPPDVQLLEEIRDLLKQQANGTKSAD